jgi:ketosteroid isomerase-like protein
MTQRLEIEKLLRELYAARVEGQLDRLCALFSVQASFKIVGASEGKPIAITARGSGEIRAWLAVMLKTFKLSRYQQLGVVIEGARASVHWRADIHSKITGVIVPTELVDLVEISDGKVSGYHEFFAPC